MVASNQLFFPVNKFPAPCNPSEFVGEFVQADGWGAPARHAGGLRFESARAYHLKSPSNFLRVISCLCFVFSLRNCAPRFGSDALTVLSKEDANTFDKVIATNLRASSWYLDRRPCCRRQSRKISTSIF